MLRPQASSLARVAATMAVVVGSPCLFVLLDLRPPAARSPPSSPSSPPSASPPSTPLDDRFDDRRDACARWEGWLTVPPPVARERLVEVAAHEDDPSLLAVVADDPSLLVGVAEEWVVDDSGYDALLAVFERVRDAPADAYGLSHTAGAWAVDLYAWPECDVCLERLVEVAAHERLLPRLPYGHEEAIAPFLHGVLWGWMARRGGAREREDARPDNGVALDVWTLLGLASQCPPASPDDGDGTVALCGQMVHGMGHGALLHALVRWQEAPQYDYHPCLKPRPRSLRVSPRVLDHAARACGALPTTRLLRDAAAAARVPLAGTAKAGLVPASSHRSGCYDGLYMNYFNVADLRQGDGDPCASSPCRTPCRARYVYADQKQGFAFPPMLASRAEAEAWPRWVRAYACLWVRTDARAAKRGRTGASACGPDREAWHAALANETAAGAGAEACVWTGTESYVD